MILVDVEAPSLGRDYQFSLDENSPVELLLDEGQELHLQVEYPTFVFAPVNKGETGGEIWVIIDGKQVGGCRLIYDSDVALLLPQEETDSG